MGVTRSPSRSPMPSAPNASLTPSNRPMFKDVDVILEVVAGVGTKACAHEVVAAATIIEDFIFYVNNEIYFAMMLRTAVIW